MAPERFLPLVEAEDRLERRPSGKRVRRVMAERVIQTMTNRPLERLMQDPAPMDAVELLQFAFELCDVPWSPLLHNRRIEAAQLRDIEQRPRPFERGRRRRAPESIPQPRAQVRQ